MSKRPGHIAKAIPISFKNETDSPMDRRNEPEFNEYFNLLWEEMEK